MMLRVIAPSMSNDQEQDKCGTQHPPSKNHG